MFFVEAGSGTVGIDGVERRFSAPCLIWLPAGCVHGFRFEPGADGAVVTAAADFLALALEFAADVTPRLESAIIAQLDAQDRCDAVSFLIAGLQQEAEHAAAGGRAARLHLLGLLLVTLARAATPTPPARLSAARRITQRFRQAVEQHFRESRALTAYARDLGISADRLHSAVTSVLDQTPGEVVHERVMTEARRALIYTSLPVSEIAYDLGFEDAAYFSRFFAKRAGVSPSGFRAAPDNS